MTRSEPHAGIIIDDTTHERHTNQQTISVPNKLYKTKQKTNKRTKKTQKAQQRIAHTNTHAEF